MEISSVLNTHRVWMSDALMLRSKFQFEAITLWSMIHEPSPHECPF